MAHESPPLPYALDALEPHIDARTLEIHHGKHHAGYVAKLNDAVSGHPGLERMSLVELIRGLREVPEDIRQTVRDNGGGHFSHSLYWTVMKPNGGGSPQGELADAINSRFGSFDEFKARFARAGATRLGSGWAWLHVKDGKLEVGTTLNHDTPLDGGGRPLLVLDVWEHAYYLQYQNKRADYIEAWWNVVNWEQVARNFQQVK